MKFSAGSNEMVTATPMTDDESRVWNLSLPVTDMSSGLDFSLDSASVLDLSDPVQLLELLATGDVILDNLDNNFNEAALQSPLESEIETSINEVFLPPKLESRNDRKQNVVRKTSHFDE